MGGPHGLFYFYTRRKKMSYEISDSREIDVDQLLELFRQTDWAKDRTAEETRTLVEHSSLVLSVREGDRLVAFARVLTDFIFRASVYDVVVRNDVQQKGIGRALINKLLGHPSLRRVPAFHLLTKDKRPFYEKLGFEMTADRGLSAMILVRDRFSIRSPRERLAGYVILPRLIDKVRLHSEGRLPPEYVDNLLGSGLTLDGRFLSFTALNAEALRSAILDSPTDEALLAWIEKTAAPHTPKEKDAWAAAIDAYRPDPALLERRKTFYPELASKIDLALVSVFDMIDLDEGKIQPQ